MFVFPQALNSKGLRLKILPVAVFTLGISPSPEFKGIKTRARSAACELSRISPRPEFKGIKTALKW